MAENDVVRARIDGHIKAEASAVLAAMGLTLSDAFGPLVMPIAREKALPFEPLAPNAETIELSQNKPFPHRYLDHALSGKWNDCRDCHLKPDFILIYRKCEDDSMEFVRLGPHSELGL